MRRTDREITSFEEKLAIIGGCKVCRLAMVDNGKPYIVPLNFGFDIQNSAVTLYFHCATEGRKIDILKENPHVCFEMDIERGLITGETACSHSYRYESVIGTGKAEFITDKDGKKHALNVIMQHLTGKEGFLYDEKLLEKIAALKLTVDDFTAKRRI